MDFFWLIPVGIVVVIFCSILYAYISRRPLSPSQPNVLVDKPAAEPDVELDVKNRDWVKRPVGSFLDWHYGDRK